jgi:hypothetical protein
LQAGGACLTNRRVGAVFVRQGSRLECVAPTALEIVIAFVPTPAGVGYVLPPAEAGSGVVAVRLESCSA